MKSKLLLGVCLLAVVLGLLFLGFGMIPTQAAQQVTTEGNFLQLLNKLNTQPRKGVLVHLINSNTTSFGGVVEVGADYFCVDDGQREAYLCFRIAEVSFLTIPRPVDSR